MLDGFALTIAAEMGNRLPEDMKEQFRNMIHTGVTVPSLSHYVKYAAFCWLCIE